MEPFSSIQPQRAQKLRYVLCDIDDTITTGGSSLPNPMPPFGGSTMPVMG